MMEQCITVAILAGGRARRMGEQDKGLIMLNDKPLIKHVIDTIFPQNSNIIINANRNIAQYESFGFPVIQDEWPEYQGPLAGMASMMEKVTTPWMLTLPCDTPMVAPQFQNIMWSNLTNQQTDLVVAHDGKRLQSVHALLPISISLNLRNFLDRNERRLDAWFSQHAMGIADLSQHAFMFDNLNSPDDMAAFQKNSAITSR